MKNIILALLVLGAFGLSGCDDGTDIKWVNLPPEEIVVPEPTPPVVEPVPPIEPPVVDPVPPIEPPVVEPVPPIEPPVVVPPIAEVQEFIPFDTELSMPYLPSDYEAIAAQDVVFKGDLRSYEGLIYMALQDHSTYPNEANIDGNPFYVISDMAYEGGYYFRQKPNEPTCTEKVTFLNMPEINDTHVWNKGYYGVEISQTENCNNYGILDPYTRLGNEIGTDVYSAVTLGGWKFVQDETLYIGYKRDYEIIPTPGSEDDLNFWTPVYAGE